MQMTCPKCHGPMRQYERGGVTVDQCAECRGIFLDRGELERLLDAEQAWHGGGRPPQGGQPHPPQQPYPPQPVAQPYPPQHPGQHGPGWRDYDSDEYPKYGHGHAKRKKHRGFLDELFG